MLEILLFVALGIILGVIFGLLPGIHPNFIVLFIPLLLTINLDPFSLLAFIVSMAVTNTVIDTIPSILFGAPEEGSELSVLPGHKMLMRGQGYQAVKLTVLGSFFSVIVLALLLPLLVFGFPFLASAVQPFIFFFLLFISAYFIIIERGKNILYALVLFLSSGFMGLLSFSVPLSSSLLLFPILSGLFGASTLIMQIRSHRENIPQQGKEDYISQRLVNRSVIFGSLGGIFSGFLPGVGTSQIAALASADKNEKSFLTTMGAITTANIVMSMLALYLIGKTRSGASIIIENLIGIGLMEILFIVSVALVTVGIASLITLSLTKRFLSFIQKINYMLISKAVLIFISAVIIIFTGPVGFLLFATSTALGLLGLLSGVRRANLMGVLLLPTMLLYLSVL